ncbi:MAG: FAD-dependent thymidylate synthase [Clostridiaceae bacterium]|nr:FAD-dependent thymidylate synthase [Clostridiaceae bacterium]
MLNVQLVTYTPEPEKLVAAAAKMCYSASGADAVMDGLTPDRTAKFLDMLTELGHESPIEHASFTFAVEGVSRSLLAQLTRHRIASFSVQSQRYVKENQFTYITPPEIAADAAVLTRYTEAMDACHARYLELSALLEARHLSTLLAEGVPEKQARARAEKMAIEDARYVLPNACETKLMMTMNARALYNFFRLRCCNRAQWEIREMAWQMLFLCREAAPVLFAKAGPSCLHGACQEGSMSCGKMTQVRARSECHG